METSETLIQRLMQLQSAPNDDLDELMKALAQRRMAAETEATNAKQQADQAHAQPAPETPALADLVTRAMGSVASTFQGTRKPLDHANELIENEKKQLLVTRAQDLARLDQTYEKAIARAQKLGDDESTMKYQLAKEGNSKTRAELLDLIHYKMDSEDKRYVADRAAGAKIEVENLKGAKGVGGIDFSKRVNESPFSKVKFVNRKDLGETAKTKEAGIAWADANDIKVLDDRDAVTLKLLATSGKEINNIADHIINKLSKDPNSWKRLGNKLAVLWDPELGSYKAFRTSAVGVIQALTAPGRSFRITNAEIQAALHYDIPDVSDTQAIAIAKLKVLRMMLEDTERSAIGDLAVDELEDRVNKYADYGRMFKENKVPEDLQDPRQKSVRDSLRAKHNGQN